MGWRQTSVVTKNWLSKKSSIVYQKITRFALIWNWNLSTFTKQKKFHSGDQKIKAFDSTNFNFWFSFFSSSVLSLICFYVVKRSRFLSSKKKVTRVWFDFRVRIDEFSLLKNTLFLMFGAIDYSMKWEWFFPHKKRLYPYFRFSPSLYQVKT